MKFELNRSWAHLFHIHSFDVTSQPYRNTHLEDKTAFHHWPQVIFMRLVLSSNIVRHCITILLRLNSVYFINGAYVVQAGRWTQNINTMCKVSHEIFPIEIHYKENTHCILGSSACLYKIWTLSSIGCILFLIFSYHSFYTLRYFKCFSH